MSVTNGHAGAPYSWPQLWRDLLQFMTMAFALYASHVGARNNDKIQSVEVKQEVAAQKAEVVKEKIEAREDGDAKAIGMQLYTSYKYLEEIAHSSGSPRDVGKAAEAKSLYEAHVRKYGAKVP